MTAAEVLFPAHLLSRFVDTLSAEIGSQNLSAVLEKENLPVEWSNSTQVSKLDGTHVANVYAGLQMAMRTYYGRGARGVLLRIGSKLWERVLNDAALGIKTQSALIRGLPVSMRTKPALELAARLLSGKSAGITVHILDLDLLFVDHVSPTTLGQKDSVSICYVTQGFIREALFWAVGREFDIEKISCRATGQHDCEFKIIANA
jgi:predicted hydrocarbon binding protein